MKNLQAQAVAVAGFPPMLQMAGSNPAAVYPVVSTFLNVIIIIILCQLYTKYRI